MSILRAGRQGDSGDFFALRHGIHADRAVAGVRLRVASEPAQDRVDGRVAAIVTKDSP